ncbi:MAG: radical SAM protein [Clostridiales bacterium]|jgi:biotin synthase-related radical SAM superfamily protein|nr:radical SAM protein [Clostridiales bacterium]
MGIKQRISDRVASQLKGALPLGAGDKALNGLIGKLIANPDRTENLFGEGEIFLIKAALYLTGVKLDESAYDGIGTVFKELVGVYQFDLNLGKTTRALPSELALPHGFHVPVVVNDESPFVLERKKGILYLTVNELRLFAVEFEKRPDFYGKKTTDGVEMWKLAQHRLGDELMVTYNTYCHTLKGGNQCRFCSLSPHEPIHRRKNSFFIQTPEQIAEVAEAAYKEGVVKRLEITGGILPNREEIDFICEVGNAIKKRLGTETVPGGHVLVAAPNDLSRIDDLKAAGWEYIFFNLEIWDENLFKGLCPGKQALIGRDHWLKALDYAVTVFGKGNVRSILIAGLEPLKSYLEGLEYLTAHGVYADPSPWMPMRGSLMEGHNTPSAQWHITLLVKTLDLWEQHGWDLASVAKDGWLSFNDLASLRIKVRERKKQEPDYPIEDDLRYKLAVLGKLDF